MLQRKSEEDFQDGGKGGGSGGEEMKGGGAATLKRRHITSDTLTSTGLFQSPRLALVGGRNEESVLTFASQMDHGQFPTNISPAARRPGALSAKVLSLSQRRCQGSPAFPPPEKGKKRILPRAKTSSGTDTLQVLHHQWHLAHAHTRTHTHTHSVGRLTRPKSGVGGLWDRGPVVTPRIKGPGVSHPCSAGTINRCPARPSIVNAIANVLEMPLPSCSVFCFSVRLEKVVCVSTS